MDKCLKKKTVYILRYGWWFHDNFILKKAHMILSHKSEYATTNIPKITVNMVQFIITIKCIKFEYHAIISNWLFTIDM